MNNKSVFPRDPGKENYRIKRGTVLSISKQLCGGLVREQGWTHHYWGWTLINTANQLLQGPARPPVACGCYWSSAEWSSHCTEKQAVCVQKGREEGSFFFQAPQPPTSRKKLKSLGLWWAVDIFFAVFFTYTCFALSSCSKWIWEVIYSCIYHIITTRGLRNQVLQCKVASVFWISSSVLLRLLASSLNLAFSNKMHLG